MGVPMYNSPQDGTKTTSNTTCNDDDGYLMVGICSTALSDAIQPTVQPHEDEHIAYSFNICIFITHHVVETL